MKNMIILKRVANVVGSIIISALMIASPVFANGFTDAVMVKDINPGSGGSQPGPLTDVAGTLYFRADDGTNGWELWKSDGTSGGTVMVKDINLGSGHSYPSDLTDFGGTLYFKADDGTNGSELWKSDGTSGGTVMVKDINPGSGNSYPSYLTDVAGILFFRADDGTNGDELWKGESISEYAVEIDIKPGGFPNSINLRSKGRVPVAILTTDTFDASTVDPETVVLEGAAPVKWNMVDVPEVWDSGTGVYIGDGDTDLLLHFKTQELSLTSASTEATLTGETFGGVPIEGTDSVKIPKGSK